MSMIREHPPTAAAAVSALLASLATDVEPYLADLPVISEGTAGWSLVLLLGLAGGLVGKLAERWTIPWQPAENAADHEGDA